MATKYKGVLVTFERDLGAEDADKLCEAISMIRGVCDVRMGLVESQYEDHMARQRVRIEVAKGLADLHQEILNPTRK